MPLPLAAIVVAAVTPVASQSGPAPVRCPAELEAQRAAWHAAGPAWPQPPVGAGLDVRHWATRTMGVWLIEQTSPTATALTRVAAGRIERVEWGAACVPTRRSAARPVAAAPAFTDADLAALVESGASGVIYLWSPHLPLSVDGYAQVAAAADRRGVKVEPLLAADADRRFAAEAVASGRLPATALRAADAVELEFRGLALHAPAVLVFAGGRLRGAVLPGYKTADEYSAFFTRVLDLP